MKRDFLYCLIVILILVTGCSNATKHECTKLDITGNWQDEQGFTAKIRTSEPALRPDELKSFHQELILPEGSYRILFEYDQFSDLIHGGTFDNDKKIFNGFSIDGVKKELTFSADPPENGNTRYYRAESDFKIGSKKTVRLGLDIHNTRAMRTLIEGNVLPVTGNKYFAPDPGKTSGEYLLIKGIPFLARKVDIRHDVPWFSVTEPSLKAERGSLVPWNDGMNFDLKGTKVRRLHFLGMIHQVDIANGSWYCLKDDYGYSHFLGDKAGEIMITLTNNETISVPLIFGFNMWYSRPWDMFWCFKLSAGDPGPNGFNYDSTIFCGNKSYRNLIGNTLSLTDGMRLMGSGSNNTRFIFTLDLQDKSIRSVGIKGNAEMYGHPLISAITVETPGSSEGLTGLPMVCSTAGGVNPVTLDYIKNEAYKDSLEKLKHVLYTYKNEMPVLKDPVIPEEYFGPRYDFKGTQEAVYAATYLYRNGPECGTKIADRGNNCASSTANKELVHYTFGTGIWMNVPSHYGNLQNWFRLYKAGKPGNFPGEGTAWSRGIGELMREAMAFGYDKYIGNYTDWLDSCLFREANPPHWIRVVGSGNRFEGSETRNVGGVKETGNRENDGHGICMWGRYMVYHWLGDSREWNERHWEATKASVKWIQWQLDTDTIFPGKRKDILYTESECGNYEFYASYNCLHGIALSIRMAKALGKNEEVESWTKLYYRLQKGMLDNAIDSSAFGPVWHTDPENNWRDDGQKLVHIQLAPDGFTYTPLQDYASADPVTGKFLRIDLNSYRYLMKDKNYNFLRSYGYGQGMITQAALLLDQMNDAENLINMMVTHCYLPRLEGWTGPEGIIVHKSGDYWVAVNGYLGQDSHLADSQKSLRLMLGIDDNNSDHLRLVPRYPMSWNQMSVSDFPVLTGKSRQKIAYAYTRSEKGQAFVYRFEKAVKDLSLRLGPLPAGKIVSGASFNGHKVAFDNLESGDSRWIWIKDIGGKEGKVDIFYR